MMRERKKKILSFPFFMRIFKFFQYMQMQHFYTWQHGPKRNGARYSTSTTRQLDVVCSVVEN
jgi:hypothetical protein